MTLQVNLVKGGIGAYMLAGEPLLATSAPSARFSRTASKSTYDVPDSSTIEPALSETLLYKLDIFSNINAQRLPQLTAINTLILKLLFRLL